MGKHEIDLLQSVGQIAGIGGLALAVFLLLFREVIRKNLFRNVPKDKAYKLIRLFMMLTFLIVLAGIGAWLLPQLIGTKQPPLETGIVGNWAAVSSVNLQPTEFTFTKDGRVKAIWATHSSAGDIVEQKVMQGTYHVDKEKTRLTFHFESELMPETDTIVQLTENQMVLNSPRGGRLELKKIQP